MKKLALILLSALAVWSCDPESFAESFADEFGIDVKEGEFDLEGVKFGITGNKAPSQYQEIGRLIYYTSSDDDAERFGAQLFFDGSKYKLVFPSGAYRTGSYTQDKDNFSISFDKPFIYGTHFSSSNYEDGEDIYEVKYEMLFISKAKTLSLFDPAAESFDKVDKDAGNWSISFVETEDEDLPALYEISGEYGTMSAGTDIGMESGLRWNYNFVYDNATFAWTEGLDLATIHLGPKWRTPTVEEASWILENGSVIAYNSEDDGYYIIQFTLPDNKHLTLRAGDPGEECGFWLSDGSAFVYSHDGNIHGAEASIVEPESDAKYFVLGVREN